MNRFFFLMNQYFSHAYILNLLKNGSIKKWKKRKKWGNVSELLHRVSFPEFPYFFHFAASLFLYISDFSTAATGNTFIHLVHYSCISFHNLHYSGIANRYFDEHITQFMA